MSKVKVQGKTVEDAVRSALSQLQVSRDEVEVHVLEEPSKGFFGLGAKPALVEVERQLPVSDVGEEHAVPDPVQVGEKFLKQMLEKMSVQAEIEVHAKERQACLELSGPEMGKVIGRRGQTLDALQFLVNIVANRHAQHRVRIMLDTENYRSRRQQSLEQLADRIAKKAIRTHQKVVLEPMNAAERKVIHTHLQNYAGIETRSEGDEPNRRVTVHPQ